MIRTLVIVFLFISFSSCQKQMLQRELMEFWELDSIYLRHEEYDAIVEYPNRLFGFSENGITHPYHQGIFKPELKRTTYKLERNIGWKVYINSADKYFGGEFELFIINVGGEKRLRMLNDSLIISAHVAKSIQM